MMFSKKGGIALIVLFVFATILSEGEAGGRVKRQRNTDWGPDGIPPPQGNGGGFPPQGNGGGFPPQGNGGGIPPGQRWSYLWTSPVKYHHYSYQYHNKYLDWLINWGWVRARPGPELLGLLRYLDWLINWGWVRARPGPELLVYSDIWFGLSTGAGSGLDLDLSYWSTQISGLAYQLGLGPG
ncbi:hypothetical protein Fcan01_28625 [Folsomia candida]|uniref:Uncharacterized protein n=1 Tax=Folsomia candida TaxID=158441 RepID=A0A226CV38_FOLCA|nr:hypothetical protein Fcan01_28625 [Folsomia candida]